jgi:hypothetical protein
MRPSIARSAFKGRLHLLNSDIRDRLAAAQAFRWEVSQTLADMAQRVRPSGGRKPDANEWDNLSALAEWLRRGADGAGERD